MERREQIKKGIIVILALLTFGIILAIYPFQNIPLLAQSSNYGKGEVWGTGSIAKGNVVEQDIRIGPAYLQSISIYMQNLNEKRDGRLIVKIFDGDTQLHHQEISLSEIENYEWYPVKVNTWLGQEGVYTYTITTDVENPEEVLQIFETVNSNAPVENQEYRYCNEIRQDTSLAVNYRFITPPKNMSEAIPFLAIALLIGGILMEGVGLITGRKEDKNEQNS